TNFAAKFVSGDAIEVAGSRLKFRKAAIATGSRPASLSIPGLEEARFLTNETIFQLVDRPARLAVIGGGYIGCELAQTFRRLGSEVVLIYRGDRILSRDDAEAAAIVQTSFEQDGIQLKPNSQIDRVERQGDQKLLHVQGETIAVDEILVAVGRSPNIENLGLETVGVQADPKQGIIINDFLQTTNPRIYGVGDVCMQWKFTHAAHAAARIAIQNSLFAVAGIGRKKLSSLVMPSCTYIDPEVAHVGLYPHEAEAQEIAIDTFKVSLNRVDRALIDGETAGFAKIHVRKGTDRIVGATIVARHAGDLITEITLAMTNNLGLRAIANTIYPYPTQAEAIRNAADAHGRTLLQKLKPITSRWMQWQR
ncbi:MAG: FAD-dependent oxidoreductase, partial [Microcoleus sp. SIO2G3]|nr:FAD-dependent oxidoreductase [Microcoleus sp. SIO2G3]